MKSYGQYCAVAKALDIVGERWTLLIIRELLARPALRYTDIKDGLPGIASNLLTERLRRLEEDGLLERESAPPPISAALYRLTARGRDLEPVLIALGRWAASLLDRPAKRDAVRGHWYCLPLRAHLRDRSPEREPVRIGVQVDDEPLTIETRGDGTVDVRAEQSDDVNLRVEGPAPEVVDLLMGRASSAAKRRVRIRGDRGILDRVSGGC